MEVAIILTNCVLLAWKNKTERERERVARDNLAGNIDKTKRDFHRGPSMNKNEFSRGR